MNYKVNELKEHTGLFDDTVPQVLYCIVLKGWSLLPNAL